MLYLLSRSKIHKQFKFKNIVSNWSTNTLIWVIVFAHTDKVFWTPYCCYKMASMKKWLRNIKSKEKRNNLGLEKKRDFGLINHIFKEVIQLITMDLLSYITNIDKKVIVRFKVIHEVISLRNQIKSIALIYYSNLLHILFTHILNKSLTIVI